MLLHFFKDQPIMAISAAILGIAVSMSIISHDWKSLIYQLLILVFVITTTIVIAESENIIRIQDDIIHKQDEIIE